VTVKGSGWLPGPEAETLTTGQEEEAKAPQSERGSWWWKCFYTKFNMSLVYHKAWLTVSAYAMSEHL